MDISVNTLTTEQFLELISTPEAVAFYKRQGFEERPCDWDGPGMFRMVRKD